MDFVTLLLVLVIVGVVLWAINTYVPMDSKVKTLLNVVAIILICLWLLQTLGLIGALNQIQVK